MRRPAIVRSFVLALLVLLALPAACRPAGKPADGAGAAARGGPPPPPDVPATGPGPAGSAAMTSSATTSQRPANDEPDEPKTIEPYKVGVTLDPTSATTKEDVTVTWAIDGGPRAKSVRPFAQVKVEWTEIRKPGPGKPAPPTVETFPAVANICASTPIEKVTFPMQAKKNAAITVTVVACQRGNALEGSKGIASTSLTWISPYVSALDLPAVITAGAPASGRIEFKGLDGPNAPGAPPKVWITSNNPGVTITKQPKVEPSSTFELAVKPDVSGDVKLTANHVNTDGQGKLLGTNTKTATVKVRSRK